MPITIGTLSCRLFRVDGKPPTNFRDTYPLQIKRYAYHPPKVEEGEMRSMGWVNPRRILHTDMTLDEVLLDEWLILALRIDKITLNGRLFKARVFEEMDRVRKEKQRDRLSRDERVALQNQVQMEMAKRQTPSTAIQEMAWNLRSGQVVFTATGDKLCLEFQEYFSETFSLALEPLCPYIRAEVVARNRSLQSELLSSQPAAFSSRSIVVAGSPVAELESE